MKELEIYANGFIYCSVCTNIESRERIEELVNLKNPTGISSRWKISKDKFFAERRGKKGPNPSPCEQKPKTHKHYLMEC